MRRDAALEGVRKAPGVLWADVLSEDDANDGQAAAARRAWRLAEDIAARLATTNVAAAEVAIPEGMLVLVREAGTVGAALAAPGTVTSVVRYEMRKALVDG